MKKLFLRAEFGPLWGPWEVDETPRKCIDPTTRTGSTMELEISQSLIYYGGKMGRRYDRPAV